MKALKKVFTNNTIKCAIVAFIQGFLGVFSSSYLLDIKDLNTLKTLLISCMVAGISAVINLIKNKLSKE